MTTAVICIFIVGYIMIAMENVTKVNKSAVALLMAVLCWTLLYMGADAHHENLSAFTKTLGETSEIIFFLMGAMLTDGHKKGPEISNTERMIVLAIGVGGLLFVPVFRFLTGLPPFMGILLVLAMLWVVTEFIFKQKKFQNIPSEQLPDVTRTLHKIDFSTLLFFLGILTTVSALDATGVLKMVGKSLDTAFGGNPYYVTGIIGILSSIVDNVPLVASCMGMYEIAATGTYAIDGTFWTLLAYTAGIGGSLLIIGSTAGVVVMGLQNISFGWYLRRFTWIALTGFISGILVYWLQTII